MPYTGFQTQEDNFAKSFTQGYNLMDGLYKQVQQNQLKSKLAEMYTSDPNMGWKDRMKKTLPILAMYGEPNKALELELAMGKMEETEAMKQAQMQQTLNMFGMRNEFTDKMNEVKFNNMKELLQLRADNKSTPRERWYPVINPKTNKRVLWSPDMPANLAGHQGFYSDAEAPESAFEGTFRKELSGDDNTDEGNAPPLAPVTPNKNNTVDPSNPLGFKVKKK